MPNHRIVLTLAMAAAVPLLALAQAPPGQAPAPAAPAGPPTPAEQTLDAAIEKLKALQSVRAKVRQEVDMLGEKFSVVGQYLKGPNYRVRLELEVVGLPETEGRMLQISDGNVLWDYSRVLGQEYYGKMEIQKVLDRLNSPDFDESIRSYYIQQQFGLSGPQTLLEGLRQSAKFDVREEGELDGKAVWILRGRWSDMSALGLGPMAPIPAYIPGIVAVWLGKEDGWPYQVQLQGKRRPDIAAERKIQLGPDGRPVGNITKQEEEPLSQFLLRYEEVELNPQISEADFSFAVPAATVRDTTPERLAELDNVARILASQKQMEAAKSGAAAGDLLKQGIEVTPPEGPLPGGAGIPPGGPATGGTPPPG